MLRRRLAVSLIAIAVVFGLTGGLATGLVAGAARTRTAVDRLLEETRLPDVMVTAPTLTEQKAEEIRRIPGVQGAALLAGLAMYVPGAEYFNITASVDGRYGIDIDVPRIVRGRAADPDSSTEIVLGEQIAELLAVDVGDVVRFQSHSVEQLATWTEPTDEELNQFLGPTVVLRVVGVSRHPAELTTDDPQSYFLALPPGFMREYAGRIGEYFRFVLVDLGSAPTPEEEGTVSAKALDIAGDDAGLEESGEQSGGPVKTTLDFVGMSMTVLALVVALAGAIVGGLVVMRTVARAADETTDLPAVGMTTSGRAWAIIAALSPAALAGAVISFTVALVSSMFVPFGLARLAEPHPGVRLDAGVLAVGSAATIALALATAAAVVVFEVRRSTPRSTRQSTTVARLARWGVPVGPLVGVDLAVGSGRAGTRGAGRLATAAVALAMAGGVGALVLDASIGHLRETPAAYGWTWDFVVPEDAVDALADDPAVEAISLVATGPVALNGRPTIVRGMTTIKGPSPVAIVEGRSPQYGEVVLGRRTMADLGVDIGDTVIAEGGQEQRSLLVVGEAVFAGIIDVPEAGWGAAVDRAEFDALGVDDETGTGGVVTLADGVDRDRFVHQLEVEFGDTPTSLAEPVELARIREIAGFPWVLSAFLVAVGLIALTHAVIVTVRRRGRDLAVLRSMGLPSRGVFHAITVQSSLLAVVGAVIGLPLGVIVGHALWRAVASSLGVVVLVSIPWPVIIGSALGGFVAVAALAQIPAWAAARRPIAVLLRTE
jgi:putative ABC transport system permease protein